MRAADATANSMPLPQMGSPSAHWSIVLPAKAGAGPSRLAPLPNNATAAMC